MFKHAIISFFQFSQGERSEGKRREHSRATVGGEKQKTWVKGEGWRSIITEVSAGDSEDPHGREDKDVADSEQEVGQGLEEPVVHALSFGLGVNGVLEPTLPQIKINLSQKKKKRVRGGSLSILWVHVEWPCGGCSRDSDDTKR